MLEPDTISLVDDLSDDFDEEEPKGREDRAEIYIREGFHEHTAQPGQPLKGNIPPGQR